MGTDLDSIFARLQEAASKKERREEHKLADVETVCVCDRSGIFLQKPASREAWSFQRSETPLNSNLKFAVCPDCDPKPNCRKCEGTGHLAVFNLVTQTEDLVPNGCSCQRLVRTVDLLNAAGIPQRYMSVGFSTLDFSHLSPEPKRKLQLLSEAALEFCDVTAEQKLNAAQGIEKPFLTFMGPVGSGKTHLAVSVLKRLIMEHGFQGKFLDFTSFLGDLRHTYASKSSENSILEPLFNAEVLVIDELGKGRTENEWQLEKLDDLINQRYNFSKITILTTNYLHSDYKYDPRKMGLKEIPTNESFWKQNLQDRIGARMYDRLLQSSRFLVFLGVESFRRRQLEDLEEKMRPVSV